MKDKPGMTPEAMIAGIRAASQLMNEPIQMIEFEDGSGLKFNVRGNSGTFFMDLSGDAPRIAF